MNKIIAAVAAVAPILAVALGYVLATAPELSWTRAAGGTIPEGAIVFGNESSGEALFVCRAEHAGGIHLGKIRAPFGGCNIPYGGREIVKKNYEVLATR